jgi:hypothetical protein
MLLRWPRIVVFRHAGMAMVTRTSMLVTVIMVMVITAATSRRSYSISSATPTIFVAIRLIIVDAVSNSSAAVVIDPAAVPSIGNTAA